MLSVEGSLVGVVSGGGGDGVLVDGDSGEGGEVDSVMTSSEYVQEQYSSRLHILHTPE